MKRAAVVFLLIEFLTGPLYARTWHVPSEAPTIQAGIDSASAGDIVLLADKVYSGPGNRDVSFDGKAITVQSESSNPRTCIINCEQSGRGFSFSDGEGLNSVLRGVTIENGFSADNGGGLLLWQSASPTIETCILSNNTAINYGGGMFCYFNTSPIVNNCVFSNNTAGSGGGVILFQSSASFTECLFAGNTAAQGLGGGICCEPYSYANIINCTLYANYARVLGGGIFCDHGSAPIIDKTIIVFSEAGGAFQCTQTGNPNPQLMCCNLYGNIGGDWADCIAEQQDDNGNFSADPCFCDAANRDFALAEDSLCLPGHHPWGCSDLVGAYSMGCGPMDCSGPVPTERVSWGSLKAKAR